MRRVLWSRESVRVLDTFRSVWCSWVGNPQRITCDRDGAFKGEFVDQLEKEGVDFDQLPAEAHWQIGRNESHGKAWKYMARRCISEKQLSGVDDMKQLSVLVSQAKKSRVRQAGYSPYQWTFGKDHCSDP